MRRTIVLMAALLLYGTLIGCAPASDRNGTQKAPVSPTAAASLTPGESSPAKAEEPTPSPEAPTPAPTPTLPPMQGMGNSSLNIRNAGCAVLSGDTLYYIDQPKVGNIWRADPDGGNARMLAEGRYRNLNVSGGRLFFTDWATAIYVMPLDGTQPQIVKECKDPSLCVLDEWLYYTDDNDIRRMRSDGAGDTLLAKGAGRGSETFICWQIHNGWLYYLHRMEGEIPTYLWKTALDGSESARVLDTSVRDFLIYEDHIYYVDWERSPYGILKMAMDGTGQQEIYKQNVELFTAADGWIYLRSKPRRDAVQGLYRIRTDGGIPELVAEGYCYDISVAGGWLFFYTGNADPALSKMKLDGSERGFVNE